MFSSVLALTIVMPSVVHAGVSGADEYQVKAAFLFNFAKFIEWPDSAFKTPDEPISICVLGKNPFVSALEGVVRGNSIGGRNLVVREVSNAQQANSCHILFVDASKPKQLRQLLEDLKGLSILTVGNTEDFAANGGMINFKLKDGRIRFEIAVDAAERARLRISSTVPPSTMET